MTTNTAVTEALMLAQGDIPVFPCFPIGSGVNPKTKRLLDKSPRVTAWGEAATTDAAQIQQWWSQWPDALVGVPTGAKSGLFVLDLDIKNGKDGPAALAKMGRPLPDTRVNWTLTGGQHALYRAIAGSHCPTNSDVIAPGVDLRGDGGYIIWWPAHGGRVDIRALAPAPEWMTKEDPTGPSMPPMGISDEEIEELLRMIPPAKMESRSEWIKLGMALHHETEGDMLGMQLWNTYSATWPKYDGIESIEREWKSFGSGKRTHVTLRSFVPPGWRRRIPNATEVFGGAPIPTGAADVADETFMDGESQKQLFDGCVYVANINRIITREGREYDQARFNAIYGGRSYMMDMENARVTRHAWEAFLESQIVRFPKVDGTIFRPELPAGAIIGLENHTYLNTYAPIETLAIEGDPSPFLDLVAKMLPVERDRKIILTYMASMIRNPGSKFQWWPVLQGTEGNGKSAFIRILTHCIGDRYTHLPNVAEMAKNGIKFNSWIVRKLFLGFEEVYVPNRREFLEEIKATVTNNRSQVERKGVDQTMEDNRANGFMCTNHRDGVPTTIDSRRYAVFYTHQQSKEDKLRDGMGGNYFPDLYHWFNGTGKWAPYGPNYGYAVVNWYLRHVYELSPEFDPAGACQEAPSTSSSAIAIVESYGMVEQEILEAIETEEAGFRGGFISSRAIEKLLEKTRMRMSFKNRARMVEQMGYIKHPALKDGRTTHGTLADGLRKVVLYVKKDCAAAKVTDVKTVMDLYIKTQT